MAAVRHAVTLAAVTCLLAGCTQGPDGRGAPGAAAQSSPGVGGSQRASPEQTSPEPTRADPGTVAASGAAADLARQLDLAADTLRDMQAQPDDVRWAGRLQQLAVRSLAAAPAAHRRRVLERVRPGTARLVRDDVRSAGLLRGLTPAQPRLPRWRIVLPPPPARLLGWYRDAQRRTDVPWTYLAAIHLVETRMGRIRGTSSAGARGPMQFLPSTWELYGGRGDINDPRDAILAAARLLRANGAPGDMADALWHYNPSDLYVRAVTGHARTMQRDPWVYRGYWHWQVLYRHQRGTFVLPVGYPERSAERLPGG